ncbi:hypothetical protein [Winogradskyella aurantia]|uniref:Uncharacterized protein n=1 Tax=Winogradskyella aurantia TaxID=1915063 RepID=A0A265UVF3_9FLAO|nr:hypothetical protein [Winogradskyella aurantia]OZV69286.1 hypothetical protein CA834_07470 [Winogradskyella aurantia]
MKLLRIFQYAYIIFAILFLYDAISNWSVDRNRAYMSLFFAALGVFMFFFRRRFAKKFQDRNND